MYSKKRSMWSLSSILLVLVVIVTVLSNIGDKNRSLNILGYRPVLVVSGSMLPSIQINSISIMKYCNADDVKVGDVIMYYHPDMDINITHRVIDKKINLKSGKAIIHVQGDANARPDNIDITDDLLIGKLIKTFNQTAPFISLLMEEEGRYNKLAVFIFIFIVATVVTIITEILGFLDNVLRAVYYVVFKKHKVEDAVNKLSFEQNKLVNLTNVCSKLNREDQDAFKGTIAKIVTYYNICRYNEAVEELLKEMEPMEKLAVGDFKEELKKCSISADNKNIQIETGDTYDIKKG